MEISANFAFLKQEFPHAAESASYAELHVYGDGFEEPREEKVVRDVRDDPNPP